MKNWVEIYWQKKTYHKFIKRFLDICKFLWYKTDTASDKLSLPSDAYWHTLEDVLTEMFLASLDKMEN